MAPTVAGPLGFGLTEQGIADTTVNQIARRADVSVGTVYHHFSSYDDVIRACGQLTFAADAIFAGCRSTHARVGRLTHELFACYERFPRSGEHALRPHETAGAGLAALAPRTLALMHGSSFGGDCAGALVALADDYARRLDSATLAERSSRVAA
jgi:AcrR family transcriptional regulator